MLLQQIVQRDANVHGVRRRITGKFVRKLVRDLVGEGVGQAGCLRVGGVQVLVERRVPLREDVMYESLVFEDLLRRQLRHGKTRLSSMTSSRRATRRSTRTSTQPTRRHPAWPTP